MCVCESVCILQTFKAREAQFLQPSDPQCPTNALAGLPSAGVVPVSLCGGLREIVSVLRVDDQYCKIWVGQQQMLHLLSATEVSRVTLHSSRELNTAVFRNDTSSIQYPLRILRCVVFTRLTCSQCRWRGSLWPSSTQTGPSDHKVRWHSDAPPPGRAGRPVSSRDNPNADTAAR